MAVLYQKPGRPIWLNARLGLQDLQGAIPRAWCVSCGTEVFLAGRLYCHRCEKEEQYDKQMRKSL